MHPSGEVCRYHVGHVDPYVAACPHYRLVEKGENHLQWRFDLYKKAARSKPLQRALLKASAEDVLFWINAFVFIPEPRGGEDVSGIVPFNTWIHQDPVFARLAAPDTFGRRHTATKKSRAQGGSLGYLSVLDHKFLFRPMTFNGMASKDEKSADSASRPGSLGWKVDFIHANLPEWMRPPGLDPETGRNRSCGEHTWRNVLNGSTWSAEAATPNTGRSDRFTVFLGDEAAFFVPGHDRAAVANLLQTTNGLWLLSTPFGMDNQFYDTITDPGPWLTCILDWKDNPAQTRGLYRAEHGDLIRLDPTYSFPENYKFNLDGRTRSPWYDRKCAELSNNMILISQELDMEFAGSTGRPFDANTLAREKRNCRDPITGTLHFEDGLPDDVSLMEFKPSVGGKLKLWVPIEADGFPPVDVYAIGNDIAQGTAGETSSNSVMSVWNLTTREQVAEYADNIIRPVDFAQYVVACCYWFGHGESTVLLNWEKPGPGAVFGKEVVRLRYPNVYWMPTSSKTNKRVKLPGFHGNNRTETLSALTSAMSLGNITIRSAELVNEMEQFVIGSDGHPLHPKMKSTADQSAQGISHGDRVVAASVALVVMDRRSSPVAGKHKLREIERKFTESSIAGRAALRSLRTSELDQSLCIW